jgi:hypothetical protein
MHAAPDLPLGDLGEPPLHQVEPTRPGGREVQVIAGPLRQPAPDQLSLVGSVVVEDEMNGEGGRDRGVNPVEELPELAGPVPRVTLGSTAPVRTSRAAKSEVVPCRT